ncbi:coiled-coil domain-containing protein 86 [Mugil cephalus]|uniref:coiled-coil domain-containing protein 86 n=1 Tax=Mugil cephalus TaxID=48193 RepID=UPI001FB8088C|nr:coiled-coil domain-containing protein 86 [Mugil cephalus]
MSKRTKAMSEAAREEDLIKDPPPETRRTRSGRAVRTPAALVNSEAPVRTPSRRTRRSVLLEVQEKIKEEPEKKQESLAEEESVMSTDPEPCTVTEPEEPAKPAEPQTEAATADTDKAEVNGSPPMPAAAEKVPASSETIPKKKRRTAPSVKQNPVIPLGKPKSGRVWKDRNKQRFSALVRDKPLCSSWEKKMQAKREKDLVKKYSQQLKDEKIRQKEEKRKRREENLRRRAENERKAEIVQVIRNTSKIKRMKKKQLRRIEKRDTLALLQKTQKQKVKTKAQKNAEPDFT